MYDFFLHNPIPLARMNADLFGGKAAYWQEIVDHTIARGLPRVSLRDNDIESCGKSRIPLGGLVQQLHRGNLFYLYDQRMAERQGGRDGQPRGICLAVLAPIPDLSLPVFRFLQRCP